VDDCPWTGIWNGKCKRQEEWRHRKGGHDLVDDLQFLCLFSRFWLLCGFGLPIAFCCVFSSRVQLCLKAVVKVSGVAVVVFYGELVRLPGVLASNIP
jgi:hypothetical protein